MNTTAPSSQSGPAASLLIVDADAKARASLVTALRQKGFKVDEVCSGQEALAFLEKNPLDLMVLDMSVPGMTGVEVMLRARLLRRDLLIVVLTTHATIESAVAAVRTDVVDYMLKPCRTDDLILTITRALAERAEQMRTSQLLKMVGEAMEALKLPLAAEAGSPPRDAVSSSSATEMLRVGLLALDRAKRVATVKSNPPRTVELTEGEASILTTLMEKPNQVFTYNQLAKTALGYEGMDKWTVESVIRSSVFRLRQKIEPDPETARVICTVRGRGYYFSPAVEQTA